MKAFIGDGIDGSDRLDVQAFKAEGDSPDRVSFWGFDSATATALGQTHVRLSIEEARRLHSELGAMLAEFA